MLVLQQGEQCATHLVRCMQRNLQRHCFNLALWLVPAPVCHFFCSCRFLIVAVVCNQAAAVVFFIVYMFIKKPPLDSASAATDFGKAASSAKPQQTVSRTSPLPPAPTQGPGYEAGVTQSAGGLWECLSLFAGQAAAWLKSRPAAFRTNYAEDDNFRWVGVSSFSCKGHS